VVAGLTASMVMGCLPAGEPPAGQQLVRDRTLTYAFFSPSESDAVPSHLFCTGPYRATASGSSDALSGLWFNNLYAVPYGKDVGAPTTLASLPPAVENLAPLSYTAGGVSPATDSLGRLFLITLKEQDPLSSFSPTQPYRMTRYNPRTGARESVGSGTVLSFSPSRTRVFAGERNAGTLFEREGSRPLAGIRGLPVFVGEDFYYVAVPASDSPDRPPTSSTLTRIKPDGEPEAIYSVPGYLGITAIEGGETPRLLVNQGAATPALPYLFMLDLDTLTRTPLPSNLENLGFLSASPSGRWLLFQASTAPTSSTGLPSQTLTLIDWTTGTRTDLDPAVIGEMGLGSSTSPEWRPGRDQLWIQTDKGAFTIEEPGDRVTAVAMPPGLALSPLQRADTGWYSVFTRDGLHWFSRYPPFDGRVYIGQADDPASPMLQVNPDGTWTAPYWDIGDGRLLVGAWADQLSRQELYLVALAAGTSQALAGGGHAVAVGRTRALALLEWDGARDAGTLTLIDLASGAKTPLADEVYEVAVDPRRSADVLPGTDPLAAGTKVAFLSRGRLASPYDGLWVTELP
jgi:hypothetical protein